MTDLAYSPAAVSRLLEAVLHPEPVEGWEAPTVADRLDEIAAAFVTADRRTRDELIAEAAELLTLDPDSVSDADVPTPPVSDEMDARNSRPYPF